HPFLNHRREGPGFKSERLTYFVGRVSCSDVTLSQGDIIETAVSILGMGSPRIDAVVEVAGRQGQIWIEVNEFMGCNGVGGIASVRISLHQVEIESSIGNGGTGWNNTGHTELHQNRIGDLVS